MQDKGSSSRIKPSTAMLQCTALATEPALQSTCPYCGVGCGIQVQQNAQSISILGALNHPANRGKLCIKGSNLADTLTMQHRLLLPQLGRQTARQELSWSQATQHIAEKFQHYINTYGEDSIAFYVSGQLLTEDYYVVNKFVKGYLGTANIDTNSRLCMSSAVAAHKRAFGEDIVAGNYEDFEQADVIVLVGSNTAWCHPILFQRIVQSKQANPSLKIVVIDPRFTATCEQADLHLAIGLGEDVCLFNGLLQYLVAQGYSDQNFIEQHTVDFEAALAASMPQQSIAAVALQTGLDVDKITEFYQLFAKHNKVMTLFSMGVNQSSQGSNKANSIINCHLLTGRVTGQGMGAFSMTGQPNAMGGREVGGLANMLAAHLELDNPIHQALVQQFWQSPRIAKQAGLKAVDLFTAVEEGKIKAIWIMATNPVVSLPNSDQVKRALQKCEFVVVSEVCQDTDTTAYADVLLPVQAWGEKDGTVTNSERCISRQRAFLQVTNTLRPDWWAVCQVAQKMGYQGFDFKTSHEIFIEHAQLSTVGNRPPAQRQQAVAFRYFNLQGLTQLTAQQYHDLQPIQWPVYHYGQGTARLYADAQFSFADRRARFIATKYQSVTHPPTADFPLSLNTGRVRDQWHTMSRTGLSANLALHRSEPYCEIHPQDALKFGIQDKNLVEVCSPWGRCVVRSQLSTHVRRGQVFVPIHWNDQVASDARVGAVVNPAVDALSGEPEFKHTPVAIRPFLARWQGVLFLRHPQAKQLAAIEQHFTWWVKIQTDQALRIEIVDRRHPDQVLASLKRILALDGADYEWMIYQDRQMHVLHVVVLLHDQLVAAFYLNSEALLPDRQWLARLFKRKRISALHRQALLAAMPINSVNEQGPLVCSCFKVGKNTILAAIEQHKLTDEKQVTACLKAGGNCGSCLPEIRGLLKQCQAQGAL